MKKISIAIDGPAASGKSTTARLVAKKLGYIYIDTGAMYRAATLAVLREKIDIAKEAHVTACIRRSRIVIRLTNGKQHTYLNEEDVTELIRTPEINLAISTVSAFAEVRSIMVAQQRRLAGAGGVVMDGRDIGTVVLPEAELKVFMSASLEQRARRRLNELRNQGEKVSLEEVREEIRRRDRLDASRSESPLKKAAEARELDNSQMSIEQQVETVLNWAWEILNRLNSKPHSKEL